MPTLVSLIGAASDAWDPALERAVFDTGDAGEVAGALEDFLIEQCGPIADGVFYQAGVGIVAGVRLEAGPEVVVKIHRWNVTVARLTAVQEVQAHLADSGLPAPRPLVGPVQVGHGIAVVEELLGGDRADGRDPAVRRRVAGGLCDFIAAAAPLVGHVDVGAPLLLRPPGAPLWFEPHDLRFDFAGTGEGAEWIDDRAALARRRLGELPGRQTMIGHFDWRVENLAFRGAEIAAVYDWDSVAAAPEAVIVGNAAAQFTADWTTGRSDPLPTVDEMRSFVADYEQARGEAFDAEEREALDSANLFLCAYGARCQHSDRSKHPEILGAQDPGWIRLLRERGEHALTG